MNKNIAIIGRPNVGKSALFNRISGKRKALVHHQPGTTRDRNEAHITWGGKKFTLIDTGGWGDDESLLHSEITEQMEIALADSEIVLFVVDGKIGLHPLDKELNDILRRFHKKVILVVNKIDSLKDENKIYDFYGLGGITEFISVSAIHGLNINVILDKICSLLTNDKTGAVSGTNAIRVALVGKPNVGKSSLLNRLYKQKRNIVDDKPGTTREALNIHLKRKDQDFILTDTPGIHRKRIYKDDLDYLSTLSAHKALEESEVAVLVIDAKQLIGETESAIAELILKNNCACLLVVNKWDIIDKKEEQINFIKRQLDEKLKFLWWVKLTFVSAKTGQRTENILDEVVSVYKEYSKTVPHDELREVINNAQQRAPLSRKGHIIRMKSVDQIGIRPPKFLFTVNFPELVHFSYRRYLENRLREKFGFTGTPLALIFQKSKKVKKT